MKPSRSFDDGMTPRTQADRDARRDPRHPLRLSANVLLASDVRRGCTIENFSHHGMGVAVSEAALSGVESTSTLSEGRIIGLAFILPGDGRPVRARARLEHVERQGGRITMGVSMSQSHPVIINALLAASLRSRLAEGEAQRAQAPTATPASDEPPPAPVERELDVLLPEICQLFFDAAKARLFERYESDTTHAGEYFRGLVALQGERDQLEGRLRGCRTRTGAGLKRWFARLVVDLDVNDAVRSELRTVFDDTMDSICCPHDER